MVDYAKPLQCNLARGWEDCSVIAQNDSQVVLLIDNCYHVKLKSNGNLRNKPDLEAELAELRTTQDRLFETIRTLKAQNRI